MASTLSANRSRTRSYRWQAFIWLLMTLSCGVLTALVWMYSEATSNTLATKIENKPLSVTPVHRTDITQLTHLESLHELDTDVQPLDLEAVVRDLRQYPDEFKDKRYLVANKGKWTIQVMNVAENDVIVDYLSGRKDRDKFAYFRYRDDNDQPRYMLTYDTMKNPQEALSKVRLVDFGLPANVQVLPEEVNRYLSIIDNYELAEPVVELGSNRVRQVKLQPTKREVPVRRRAASSSDDGQSNAEPERRDTTQTQSTDTSSTDTTKSDTTKRSIRQSSDTSDTFAIREKRVVADDTSDLSEKVDNVKDKKSKANQASSNTNANNKVNEKQEATASKPSKSSSTKTQSKPSTSTESAETQSRIDEVDKKATGSQANPPNSQNPSQNGSQNTKQPSDNVNADTLKQLIDQRVTN